jgi:hypothetical protein
MKLERASSNKLYTRDDLPMTNHMRECSYVKSSPIFTNQPTNYFQFQIKIKGVKEHCTIHPLFPARSGRITKN